MLGGRGGDMFGYEPLPMSGLSGILIDCSHRPMLLFGMSFFSLFTLVSALAPTFIGLVIARAFQGFRSQFICST